MVHKKGFFTLILLLNLFFFNSCVTVKDIAYFQQVESKASNSKLKSDAQKRPFVKSYEMYQAEIKPKDLLLITVVSTVPEASRIYNLIVPQVSDVNRGTTFSEPSLQTYLVDNDGIIDFPVFGKLKVSGLSCEQLKIKLQEKLEPAFSREMPIITIRITNYTVNILGEVNNPGRFTSNNDRLTIFDGIALAGDLSIYGRRDNVKILRENSEGIKEYITLNLNDKNVIYSPGYYLEQNDVVYVEPNKSRTQSSKYGTAEAFRISTLSVLLTLTSLIFTVF